MWAGCSTFTIGNFHIGVRVNDARVHEALRRILAAYLAPDVEAPPNYSVHLAPEKPGTRGMRNLHSLYRSTGVVIRTPSVRRVIDGLLRYLSAHLDRAAGEPLRVAGVPFISHEGDAVLTPPGVRRLLPSSGRRIDGLGLSAVDGPWGYLDITTGEVVVPKLALELDNAVLEDLCQTIAPEGTTPEPADGRYRLMGWAFAGIDGGEPARDDATALASALSLVVDRAEPEAQVVLEAVSRILMHVRSTTLTADDPGNLVSSLAELVSG